MKRHIKHLIRLAWIKIPKGKYLPQTRGEGGRRGEELVGERAGPLGRRKATMGRSGCRWGEGEEGMQTGVTPCVKEIQIHLNFTGPRIGKL